MGVPGEGKLVAVGVEKLKDAGLGRVEEGEAEVGVAVGGTGDGGVVVEVVVGVVDTCGGDAYWPYFEFVTRLVGFAPAAFDEGGPHAFPGECDAADLAFFAQQVAKRIDGTWCVVVVGAKDEQPWAVEQWVECLEEVGHGVDSPEVVAGVDHKVGRQLVQRGHPFFFVRLIGQHVQVGNVQDAEFFLAAQRSWFEEGQGVLVKGELVEFAVSPGGEREPGYTADKGEGCEDFNCFVNHEPRLPVRPRPASIVAVMSELQNKILADLKDSMKARNKERTATLRMLKAAVIYESVEGAKHELTDTDVLAVIRREVKKRRESAAIYAEAGRQELADAEIAEATILEEYLPQQLDDVAVAAVVNKHAAALEAELGEPLTMKHMKRMMSAVTEEVAGQADGKRLSEAVRLRIQQ